LQLTIPPNLNDKTGDYYRNILSPLIWINRKCRKKIVSETEAVTYGTHNSATKRNIDTNKVAKYLLNQTVSLYVAGREGARGGKETEAQDLFGDGLVALGEGDGIQKYKDTLDLESGGWEDIDDDEEEEVENDDGDGNTNDRVTGTVSEDEDCHGGVLA
jgi:hypothetical protein